MNNIIAFISYAVINTFTPGPNNIMSMSISSRYGFRKSLEFNLGVAAGFTGLMLICGLCFSGLEKILPAINGIMKILGAIYILYLALTILKSSNKNKKNENNDGTFIKAVLLQFINPKGVIFSITAVSTFIIPVYHSGSMLLLFSLAMAALAFISTCCWGIFGSAFNKFMAKHQKIINIMMALTLVYCAASLFI